MLAVTESQFDTVKPQEMEEKETMLEFCLSLRYLKQGLHHSIVLWASFSVNKESFANLSTRDKTDIHFVILPLQFSCHTHTNQHN